MRNVGLLFVTLAALLLVASGVPAQEVSEPLSLERAIELAVKADPSLAAAAARAAGARADVEAAESARWLRLDLEAGVQSTDNPVMVFSQKLLQGEFTENDFALTQLNTPSRHEDFSARLLATQPLWVGGRIAHGIDAARLSEQGQQNWAEATRQQLVQRVTDVYTGTTVARQQVRVAEQALETAKAHVELARSLYEGGLVVESDQLLAEVRESQIEESVLQARAASEVAAAALNLTIGRSATDPLALSDRFEADRFEQQDENTAAGTVNGKNLEQHVQLALSQRPDLLALRSFHAAALSGIERARAQRNPSVGIEAGLEAHDPDFFGTSGTNGTIMLGFRLPLFDAGERKAGRHKAEAGSLEALAQVDRLEDGVELEVRRTFFAETTARQRVVLAEKGLRLAKRSLEIVEDRYRNGITTLVDLLDAQSAVTESDVRLLQASRDSYLARVALKLATGDL